MPEKLETYQYHRFLDEAGDTTFYGKGKVPIIGTNGVSKTFILGMLKVKEPLEQVRQKVRDLQNEITSSPYFHDIPSVKKAIEKHGYFLHAKNDLPEIRKMAFDLIQSIDCSFEAVVARKNYALYESKHNGKAAEFYADLLSHLLKNKFQKYDKLVLNIAERSGSTSHNNLQSGLSKAVHRSSKRVKKEESSCDVVFNVQQPTNEPLLNIADYFCWAIQRVFERGETRFYDYISDQVSFVQDLYDFENYEKGRNCYTRKNKLTKRNHINEKNP